MDPVWLTYLQLFPLDLTGLLMALHSTLDSTNLSTQGLNTPSLTTSVANTCSRVMIEDSAMAELHPRNTVRIVSIKDHILVIHRSEEVTRPERSTDEAEVKGHIWTLTIGSPTTMTMKTTNQVLVTTKSTSTTINSVEEVLILEVAELLPLSIPPTLKCRPLILTLKVKCTVMISTTPMAMVDGPQATRTVAVTEDVHWIEDAGQKTRLQGQNSSGGVTRGRIP